MNYNFISFREVLYQWHTKNHYTSTALWSENLQAVLHATRTQMLEAVKSLSLQYMQLCGYSIDYKHNNIVFHGLSVILCPENFMTLCCREHDDADPQYCCQVPAPEFLVELLSRCFLHCALYHQLYHETCLLTQLQSPVQELD